MKYVIMTVKILAVLILGYLVSHAVIYLIFKEWDFGTPSDIITWIFIASIIVYRFIIRDIRAGSSK